MRPSAITLLACLAVGGGGCDGPGLPWSDPDRPFVVDPDRSRLVHEYPWMLESASFTRHTGEARLRHE